MSIKMDEVQAFVATVRFHSLTRAAEALGVPQSAVTRRIQNLEEELNAVLLDRDTRPPKPSALGWRVFEKCQTLLREAEELRSLVSVEGVPQGQFRLGVTQTIAEMGLFHIVDELQRHFPALGVQVMTRWSSDLVRMVESGALHAATVMYPGSQQFPDSVQAKSLMPLEMVVVCAKGEWAIRKKPYSLLDLKDSGWVLNPEGCGFRARLQQAMLDAGRPLNVVSDAFGTELQLRLIAEKSGLGLVPRPFLDASSHRDAVDIVSLSDFNLSIDLWLVRGIAPGNLAAPIDIFGDAVVDSLNGLNWAAGCQVTKRTQRKPSPAPSDPKRVSTRRRAGHD